MGDVSVSLIFEVRVVGIVLWVVGIFTWPCTERILNTAVFVRLRMPVFCMLDIHAGLILDGRALKGYG